MCANAGCRDRCWMKAVSISVALGMVSLDCSARVAGASNVRCNRLGNLSMTGGRSLKKVYVPSVSALPLKVAARATWKNDLTELVRYGSVEKSPETRTPVTDVLPRRGSVIS